MKLSEAMRLGALLGPQAFTDGRPGKYCALEGVCVAIGKQKNYWSLLTVDFPVLAATGNSCPQDNCTHEWDFERWPAIDLVWHLNDDHQWTREQIADYVEQFEQIEEVRHDVSEVSA